MSSLGSNGPVFILDCDNTLLDNDALKADLDAKVRALLGNALTEQFWQVYEAARAETGTVDFPLTLARFRAEDGNPATFERLRSIIMDYPFAARLYPEALETIRYLESIGMPAIVSDGDQVYQWQKIRQSGLFDAVGGRAVVYVHKEEHLAEVLARWPARFYVMVDDKARILAATKQRMPDRFVTAHVLQGHYGQEQQYTPAPDITIAAIGDLRRFGVADFECYLGTKQR